jgi:hypothetical protein
MRDTIELAREAGIIDFRDAFSEEHVQAVLQDLKAFEALVRADEREACAKVCETYNKRQCYNDEDMAVANECAAAIRAMGNT